MNPDFENILTVKITMQLPRADAEEYLARLVAWHEEQGLEVTGGIKYADDEKAMFYILNNGIMTDLGIKRGEE